MALKKSSAVGVSITPENGLEIAQIDYTTGTVIKYGRKSIEYNVVRREIADLDLFKDSLMDLLEELDIPKGTELVLNMPPSSFKVKDYPAAMVDLQIEAAIEEELYDDPYLKNYEPAYSYKFVNSSLQFNKVAYTAVQKSTLIELILFIREMGYRIKTIDTSVNSIFHSLVYLDRVNTEPDVSWVLLTIDNGCCRVITMLGKTYIDVYEEKISIGEVLSDAENYATVISAIEPILAKTPSKYLCIVSTTNIISAEVIANKITYSSPIIYQEANCYLKEPLLNTSSLVDDAYTKAISLEVIGAATYINFAHSNPINFNLFNKTLGDIYLLEQPPMLFNGKVVLTNELLIGLFIVISIIIAIIAFIIWGWFGIKIGNMQNDLDQMNNEITRIKAFLEAHKDISASQFDEGDEVRIGLAHNKNVYSYYTIVGTEIPKKLWLTHLKLGDKTTIEGQADNLESVYAFFRSIKDYNPNSDITLQKLGLASAGSKKITELDKDAILTTLDADFYEFRISNEPEEKKKPKQDDDPNNPNNPDNSNNNLPEELEIIN